MFFKPPASRILGESSPTSAATNLSSVGSASSRSSVVHRHYDGRYELPRSAYSGDEEAGDCGSAVGLTDDEGRFDLMSHAGSVIDNEGNSMPLP